MPANGSQPNWPKKSDWPTITLGATLNSRRPAFLSSIDMYNNDVGKESDINL